MIESGCCRDGEPHDYPVTSTCYNGDKVVNPKCFACEQEIVGRRGDAAFCSDTCRQRLKQSRWRARFDSVATPVPRPPREAEPLGAAIDPRYRVVDVASGDADAFEAASDIIGAWPRDLRDTYFANASRGARGRSRSSGPSKLKEAKRPMTRVEQDYGET